MGIEKILYEEVNRLKETKRKYETLVAIYDKHIPYHSKKMEEITLEYIKETRPKYVLDGGDLLDNPGMSEFNPDPNNKRDTQEEIDLAVQYLNRIHNASPESTIVLIPGNHDVGRLERLKSIHGHGLKNLRNLEYFKLLKESSEHQKLPLGKIQYTEKFELGPGMIFVHGDPRMTPEIIGGINGPKRTADSAAYPEQHVVYGHGHKINTVSSKWSDRQVYQVGGSLDVNHKGYTHLSKYQNGILVVHYNPNTRPKPTYHIQNLVLGQNETMIIDGKEYGGYKK